MAKALESLSDKVLGHFGFGENGRGVFDAHRTVHDGDTFTVRALGNFGLRFLGIDTPEITFRLPGRRGFSKIGNDGWDQFLDDPFAADYPALQLDPALREHLAPKLGDGCADNHATLAETAQQALQGEVEKDQREQGATNDSFRLFLRFASDVVDRYGRLLAYANRDQKEAEGRPLTYNERMLQRGFALPYFIWPNIDPFRKQKALLQQVLKPGTAAEEGAKEKLREARQWVAQARDDKKGVFAQNGLRLEPFELRYLAQRRRPDRWVIDLSSTGNLLYHPQRYFEIARHEDRLYISSDHVDLFVAAGWVKQGI